MIELAISGLSLAVMGVGIGAGLWWWVQRPAAAERQARLHDAMHDLEEAVRNVLPDPASARFRNLRFCWVAQVGYGEVNSKTRNGAYTGFVGFVVLGSGEVRLDAHDATLVSD